MSCLLTGWTVPLEWRGEREGGEGREGKGEGREGREGGREGTAAASRLGAICQPGRGKREAAAFKKEIFSCCFYPAGLYKLSP